MRGVDAGQAGHLPGARGVAARQRVPRRAAGRGAADRRRAAQLPAGRHHPHGGVSEWEASSDGIGYYIVNAQQSFDYVGMWSGIIVLAIIGTVANLLFVAAENRVLHWHYGARAVEGGPDEQSRRHRGDAAVTERDGTPVVSLRQRAEGVRAARPGRRSRSRTSRSTWRAASSPAWSGRAARARPRCCASWPGCAQPTRGEALFEGAPLRSVPPGIGVVFQDYGRSLYPWLTVARNVDLPLRVRGVPRAERAARVAEVLASVGLADAGRQLPVAAVRRHAAAGGDRPVARLPARPAADGRAVRVGGRADPVRARGPDPAGPPGVRRHGRLRHPRHRRGRLPGGPGHRDIQSPGVVTEIVDITLPRPRDQITTKADPAFARYREHLLGLVMNRR